MLWISIIRCWINYKYLGDLSWPYKWVKTTNEKINKPKRFSPIVKIKKIKIRKAKVLPVPMANRNSFSTQTNLNEMPILFTTYSKLNNHETLIHIHCSWYEYICNRPQFYYDPSCSRIASVYSITKT